MNRPKTITVISLFSLLLFTSYSQNLPFFIPFKGFHIGFTGQAEFIQKSTYINFFGSEPAPRGVVTYGWEAGIEFSYHFVKYLGVSIGLNIGTTMSYDCDIYLSVAPDFNGGLKEVNKYERLALTINETDWVFPIKLEFHYPLYKNLFLSVEAGVKLKGIFNRIFLGENASSRFSRRLNYLTYNEYIPDIDDNYTLVYEDWGYRNISKIRCDLLLGLGLYYKLPYGDLIRFTTGINFAFSPDLTGYYNYRLTHSAGTFAVKNDFIYTQLSYIHTLNWQKAKRYVKKNDYSFSSKKERRKKIVEMLNVW